MERNKLRILFLDESSEQVSAVEQELRDGNIQYESRIATNEPDLKEALGSYSPDLILTEFSLPSLSLEDSLRIVKGCKPFTPLIVVTSRAGDEVAAESIRSGASDFLNSSNLDRLCPAIQSALQKKIEQEQREKAETALREREETLRLITDNVSDLIAVLDTDGRRLYNSPSYEPILGDTHRLRGTDSFAEIHPDDRERIKKAFQETVRTGIGQRTEYRLLSSTGSTRYIESLGSLIRGKKGNPAAVVVVSRDITDRKKAEETLRVSEARFRTLFEHSSDAVALIGEDGTILYETPSVHRVLGYQQTELVGSCVFDLFHPDDLSEVRKNFQDILNRPLGNISAQFRTRHKDGTWRWIEGIGTNLLSDPLVKAIVVNYRDVGERKQAEVEMEQSLSLMKATIESTADGILVVDRDGKIVTFNEKFAEMWKIPEEVLSSGNDGRALEYVMAQLTHPDQFISRVRELYSKPDEESVDIIQFKDGRAFERLSKPQQLKGEPVGRVWSFRDISERQNAERALQHAKENYEALVNTIDGIVWEYEPQTQSFTFVSETARRLLGYAAEEWLTPGFWQDHIHPIDREWVVTFFTESTRQLKDHEFEFRMISLDGHVVWLRDIVSLIAEKGRPVKLRGVMVDVTEQKKAEQLNEAVYKIAQAAEHATTLSDLFERVHHIISGVMPAQNFYISLYDDEKDLLSFPYFVDEVDDCPEPKKPGKGLTEYVLRTGQSLLCDEEQDRKLQETGETELIGVYSPVWLGVPLILNNKTIGVMVVQHYSDPTAYGKPEQQILEFVSSQVARTIDRKRAEEVLRSNEERYRIIAEQTGQLVYDYDVGSGQITWSGAINGMTGYAREEFQEIDIRGWEEHIHEEDRETAVLLLNQALANADKYDVEYRFRRKDGTFIHVQDHGVFLQDQSEKPHRMLGTMSDITERKRLEDQLVQSQKMEAVGKLASGIAHDFNNVMGVVLTATHLIKTVAGNREIERYTNMIEGATLRGSAIAKQLLQFSRAEASRLVPISLTNIVHEVKKILDHSFPKTIRINLDINAENGMIMGDESQIHQVLLNLCINSRDAMTPAGEGEPEGILTIAVESSDLESVKLGKRSGGRDPVVVLSVTDSGSGITEDVRHRIFDPFFTTKEIGKGTGLGLSIVHGIVKNHHGHIETKSTPGKGTTFSLYFPMVRHETPKILEEAKKEVRGGGGETILVIEDESALRDLMKEILIRSGYKVIEAKDGEQGVEVYRKAWSKIDLVLSDIGLPRLSGENVLRELEKIDSNVRLIFCTGFLDGERRADLLRTGAIEVIHKPYRVSEILASVRKALGR